MGEGGGGEEKGRPDTKPFSKSCDTSRIWMWQWLDNTQYSLTSPTASKYEQSDRQGEAIEIFNRCFDFMWYFYGQRRKEKFKKALEGARSQVLSWNNVFSKPRSQKKRLCSQSMEKPHVPASAETMSDYWFHKTETKKTISGLQISKFWFTTSCR